MEREKSKFQQQSAKPTNLKQLKRFSIVTGFVMNPYGLLVKNWHGRICNDVFVFV